MLLYARPHLLRKLFYRVYVCIALDQYIGYENITGPVLMNPCFWAISSAAFGPSGMFADQTAVYSCSPSPSGASKRSTPGSNRHISTSARCSLDWRNSLTAGSIQHNCRNNASIFDAQHVSVTE